MSRNSSVESISNLAAPLQSYTTLCNAYGSERYRGPCTKRQVPDRDQIGFPEFEICELRVTPSAPVPPLSETCT